MINISSVPTHLFCLLITTITSSYTTYPHSRPAEGSANMNLIDPYDVTVTLCLLKHIIQVFGKHFKFPI